MKPTKFSYTPADDSASGFLSGATGAGPFSVTSGPGDGLAHLVTITSAADLSGITFTVEGTDADGLPQSESIVGPNATTVTGSKFFRTVSRVTVSPSLGANTANVGWKDTCVGPTFPLNWRQKNFQTSLGVNVSGTINYTVEHCLDSIFGSQPSTLFWLPHATLASSTADGDGNYAFPVTATRIRINSLTAGATLDFHVIQGY